MSRLSNLARRIDDAVFDDERLVEDLLPVDLRDRYSVTSYRSAAAVLQQRAPEELAAIIRVLRQFTISRNEIRAPGGNRMSATTRFAQYAAAENFHEEVRIKADLLVQLTAGKGDSAPEVDRISGSAALEPADLLNLIWTLALRMLGGVCAIITVIAGIDFLYLILKMSKGSNFSFFDDFPITAYPSYIALGNNTFDHFAASNSTKS